MDDTIPAVVSNEMSSKEFRQSWARLIQDFPKIKARLPGSPGHIIIESQIDKRVSQMGSRFS